MRRISPPEAFWDNQHGGIESWVIIKFAELEVQRALNHKPEPYFILALKDIFVNAIRYNVGYIKYPTYKQAQEALNNYPSLADSYFIYQVVYDGYGCPSLIKTS